jgi:hypothetical protein
MVLYYCYLLFGPPINASSIDRSQQSTFHLMTREEPSLETLWFKNIRTMDTFQITDRSSNDSDYGDDHDDRNIYFTCN